MTATEIIKKVESLNKLRFIICSEWIVERNGDNISIQHTYHFKGENFNDLKSGLKYLETKLKYMTKRGYQLTIEQ